MTKRAIIQCADAGPLESLVVMLNSVGYDCYIPNDTLRARLKSVFGDKGLVLGPRDLTARMGYDPVSVPEVGPDWMKIADLYVDVKAHQICDKVIAAWPNLKGKVLWYRINGGKPEHVINARGDHGDEVNPPCPVLTPNQWYGVSGEAEYQGQDQRGHHTINWPTEWRAGVRYGKFYCCWPPFHRLPDYSPEERKGATATAIGYSPPICLIHNVNGWGYQAEVEPMQSLGVKVYGTGSPDGLIQHREVREKLKTALAYVHLKSSDAPGYALYEALAAGCPVICTGRLIWRCRMETLLKPGLTCLTFDKRQTHDGLTPEQVEEDKGIVRGHLEYLRDKQRNETLGKAGRAMLESVMWSANKPDDVMSLASFMGRHFGG